MQYRLAGVCPYPELSPFLGSQATFRWCSEVRCVEKGWWGRKACSWEPAKVLRPWGEGGSFLFLSPQGQLHRGCFFTSKAPWPCAQSLRFDFLPSLLIFIPFPGISDGDKVPLNHGKVLAFHLLPFLPLPCLPHFSTFSSLLALSPSNPVVAVHPQVLAHRH